MSNLYHTATNSTNVDRSKPYYEQEGFGGFKPNQYLRDNGIYINTNWQDAKERAESQLSAQNGTGGTVNNGSTISDSLNTKTDQNASIDNSMQNNISNNEIGAGASVGNNNSVNIISQGQGGETGLNNMQSAAAYAGLNNNAYERSYQRLNGYGRAAGAIGEAEKKLDVTGRGSRIYDMAGKKQLYWKNSAISHQADYLGDIWKEGGFKFQMPGDPNTPEDKTEELADGFDP